MWAPVAYPFPPYCRGSRVWTTSPFPMIHNDCIEFVETITARRRKDGNTADNGRVLEMADCRRLASLNCVGRSKSKTHKSTAVRATQHLPPDRNFGWSGKEHMIGWHSLASQSQLLPSKKRVQCR